MNGKYVVVRLKNSLTQILVLLLINLGSRRLVHLVARYPKLISSCCCLLFWCHARLGLFAVVATFVSGKDSTMKAGLSRGLPKLPLWCWMCKQTDL